MNAIEFLVLEHNQVRNKLADILTSSHRKEARTKLFDELCHDLLCHEKMEETVWYPHLKRNSLLFDEIKHLIKEEKNAEKFIKEINSLTQPEEWQIKFKKFKNDIEHHAAEEENALFPLVQQLYTESELDKIGEKMAEYKYEHLEYYV